jgi:hypothetical protein
MTFYMKSMFFIVTLIAAWCNIHAQTLSYQNDIRKADSILKRKDFKTAALTFSAAFRANKWKAETDDRYDAACAWALANYPDSAFANLNAIVGKDYFDYTHLISDKDLISLHKDQRWKPLLDKTKTARLKRLTAAQMYNDFDLLISSLIEAHTGLFWYSSRVQFDSICRVQRARIKEGLNTLDFYNIIAPIVAFTKEGHTNLRLGTEAQAYLRFNGRYFPCYLKFLDQKGYIINDLEGYKTKGSILSKIDGRSMDEIMQKFLSYEPSDGFNTTSKYRWIEENAKFSIDYARCYPPTSFFAIEIIDPVTGQKKALTHIPAVNYDTFQKEYTIAVKKTLNSPYTLPAELKIDSSRGTAILTFNSFDSGEYEEAGMDFHNFVKESFGRILQQKVQQLILDIRKNGGGDEGFEDYLLSFMIDKDYTKYKYVQASAFSYSFYQYSNYSVKWPRLERMLNKQHYLENDGRILRKPVVMPHTKPQPDPYKGQIYVLMSGLTYSGGSEFAALMRNYTNAVFIGEEAGGGYYGNTSGNQIILKLPNSKLEIGIPILKFVLDTPKDDIPFGHGVLPGYEIQPTITQFLNGYDAELEFAKQLVKSK